MSVYSIIRVFIFNLTLVIPWFQASDSLAKLLSGIIRNRHPTFLDWKVYLSITLGDLMRLEPL